MKNKIKKQEVFMVLQKAVNFITEMYLMPC